MEDAGISNRMKTSLTAFLPALKALESVFQSKGPETVDFATAENFVLRHELLQLCKESLANNLTGESLNYSQTFAGDPELLKAFASFFNTYFKPSSPVKSDHIVAASGAGNALDSLIGTLCDDGDSVLVPAPYWTSFHPVFKIHANVNVVPARGPKFRDSLTSDIIPVLEVAYASAPDPKRIKALVVTNPHNPVGQCYSADVLTKLMAFCHERGLHFVSDEVYALCVFNDPKHPFVSALTLAEKSAIDSSRVHVVWSASKDFGSSGVRAACVVSQHNRTVLDGVMVSSYWQTSALSSIYLTSLLTSPSLPKLVELNSKRLGDNYKLLTTAFEKWGIEYTPTNAGLMIFARLTKATSWDEEMAVVGKLKEKDVLVLPGKMYGGIDGECGWVRMSLAVPEEVIKEGLKRIEDTLGFGA